MQLEQLSVVCTSVGKFEDYKYSSYYNGPVGILLPLVMDVVYKHCYDYSCELQIVTMRGANPSISISTSNLPLFYKIRERLNHYDANN